ncbi:MAG: MarR family transcriptional regulator [Planctomycetaceae bacterium]|nr:MarR family transcriptional regulator [Planctomycetaceae bacterium]
MPDMTVSPAALRIVRSLVGKRPQTVAELTRTMKVTRTAVTEQLNELTAAGFVERRAEKLPGRGRPRHLYRATDAALAALFPGNQQLVVPAICQAILEIGGEAIFKKVLKRVSRTMADHYSSKLTGKRPQDRIRQLIGLLNGEGGLADIEENGNGQLVLHKRSCPFISMVDSRRSVCSVDQEMLSAVVGQPVRRIFCRHDGDDCCSFEILPAE